MSNTTPENFKTTKALIAFVLAFLASCLLYLPKWIDQMDPSFLKMWLFISVTIFIFQVFRSLIREFFG